MLYKILLTGLALTVGIIAIWQLTSLHGILSNDVIAPAIDGMMTNNTPSDRMENVSSNHSYSINMLVSATSSTTKQVDEKSKVPETLVGMTHGGVTIMTDNHNTYQTTLIAGGCFWCVEADIEKLPGVIAGVAGYVGGTGDNPTYNDYAGRGFREAVQVTYDPYQVTLEQILIYAIKHMDPTDGNGSFYDRGPQYSPAFYYKTSVQKKIIDNLIVDINTHGPYNSSLAIAVIPEPIFWPAEDYHQNYYKGTLTRYKYKFYRQASGRDEFITKYWGTNTGSTLPWRTDTTITNNTNTTTYMQKNYTKPSQDVLKEDLSPLAYKVTQENGTEPSGSSPLDKNWDRGIYVDILSGMPLYSSRDKFDSGTGWPSFVKPITPAAVTEHKDRSLFSTRTEIRSVIADNHLGHVFPDGPSDRGGLRYCMNGASLKFIPEADMEEDGYGDFLKYL